MPLAMNREVFITCAVTGSGGTQDRSPHVPRSPKQIADSAIEAAKAGAAIVHCHVRDPETGKPRRDVHLYREVTERIRDANVDVVLNLTAGMGGDMVFGSPEAPLPLNEQGTDMGGATNRMEHVRQCLPEICTLDCGTMNFNEADYVMTNTPGMLRAMGGMMTALGVKPEIEAFDTGHLWFAKQLVEEGVLEARRAGAALHGRAVGRAGRPQHLHGDGQQRAVDLELVGLLASAATRWPMPRPQCWPAAMSASGSRTICGSTRACWPPTRSWSSAPSASSRTWAPGSSGRRKCARS